MTVGGCKLFQSGFRAPNIGTLREKLLSVTIESSFKQATATCQSFDADINISMMNSSQNKCRASKSTYDTNRSHEGRNKQPQSVNKSHFSKQKLKVSIKSDNLF